MNGNEPNYGKRLHQAAREDFKAFWSSHRWWGTTVALLAAIAGVLIQVFIRGKGSIVDVELTIMSGVAGLAVSLVGNYLISMRRGAEKLDSNRATVIGKRDETIREKERIIATKESTIELLTNKRTPSEEHHHMIAKNVLANMGPEDKAVLRHLWNHDSLTFTMQFGSPQSLACSSGLPHGMSASDAKAVLDKYSKDLVTRTTASKANPSGGSMPIEESTYRIAAGMKLVLEEPLFYNYEF